MWTCERGNVEVTMWTTRYSQGRRLVVVYKEIHWEKAARGMSINACY